MGSTIHLELEKERIQLLRRRLTLNVIKPIVDDLIQKGLLPTPESCQVTWGELDETEP
jgi:hypothetical protein